MMKTCHTFYWENIIKFSGKIMLKAGFECMQFYLKIVIRIFGNDIRPYLCPVVKPLLH